MIFPHLNQSTYNEQVIQVKEKDGIFGGGRIEQSKNFKWALPNFFPQFQKDKIFDNS